MIKVEQNNDIQKKPKGLSLDTNEQVVEKGETRPPKSVNSFKYKAYKIRTRNALMSRLIGYGLKVDSPNVAHYRAVERCCTSYEQLEGKYMKPHHRCGSRLCPLCANIRTAKLLDLFLPSIDPSRKWGFLTLTANNTKLMGCPPEELRKELTRRYRKFDNIRQRGKYLGLSLDCIIATEVTPEGYKKRKQNNSVYYAPHHPHFHIFGDYESLEWMREQWMKDVDCTGEHQVLKLVESTKIRSTIKEVVKYSMKPIVVYDERKENCPHSSPWRSVNLKGVDDLLTAMKGKRRLSSWGIFYAIEKEAKKVESSAIEELDLRKEVYYDLPVAQCVSTHYSPGYVQAFVGWNVVGWNWDAQRFNWKHRTSKGEEVWLFKWDKIPDPYELNCYVGNEKYKHYEKMS